MKFGLGKWRLIEEIPGFCFWLEIMNRFWSNLGGVHVLDVILWCRRWFEALMLSVFLSLVKISWIFDKLRILWLSQLLNHSYDCIIHTVDGSEIRWSPPTNLKHPAPSIQLWDRSENLALGREAGKITLIVGDTKRAKMMGKQKLCLKSMSFYRIYLLIRWFLLVKFVEYFFDSLKWLSWQPAETFDQRSARKCRQILWQVIPSEEAILGNSAAIVLKWMKQIMNAR